MKETNVQVAILSEGHSFELVKLNPHGMKRLTTSATRPIQERFGTKQNWQQLLQLQTLRESHPVISKKDLLHSVRIASIEDRNDIGELVSINAREKRDGHPSRSKRNKSSPMRSRKTTNTRAPRLPPKKRPQKHQTLQPFSQGEKLPVLREQVHEDESVSPEPFMFERNDNDVRDDVDAASHYYDDDTISTSGSIYARNNASATPEVVVDIPSTWKQQQQQDDDEESEENFVAVLSMEEAFELVEISPTMKAQLMMQRPQLMEDR